MTFKSADKNGSLLIGVGTRFHRSLDGALMIEAQTASGLKGWKRNFAKVVCFAIESAQTAPEGWVDVSSIGLREPDFKFLPLVDTYRSSRFSRHFSNTKECLLREIKNAEFCVFTYGGWIGDPGAIAASIADKSDIKYALWLDRIESHVMRSTSSNWKTRIKAKLTERNENRAVKKAPLTFLHGATVYEHFATKSQNPHICEDIHFSGNDRINDEELQTKIESCRDGPLKIIYVGRADPMKGGRHWLEVLSQLKSNVIKFEANWIGEGPELSTMKSIARNSGLTDAEVQFAGFVADREKIKSAYRSAHLLLFCHQSDESPRNLIESLHSGTPLIGYRDPFSQSLVNENGGGVLVKRGEISELAGIVAALATDRDRVIDLVRRAARSASHLVYERVFDERAKVLIHELR